MSSGILDGNILLDKKKNLEFYGSSGDTSLGAKYILYLNRIVVSAPNWHSHVQFYHFDWLE